MICPRRGAKRSRRGRRLDSLARQIRRRKPARKKADRGAFQITLDAGYLSRKTKGGARFEAQGAIEQSRRVQESIAMNAAKARKLGAFKARNHPEDFSLRAIFQLCLEAHHIEERAKGVVLPQLHDRVRTFLAMRICQAYRFHGTKPQGFAAALSHDFDRQAGFKIGR